MKDKNKYKITYSCGHSEFKRAYASCSGNQNMHYREEVCEKCKLKKNEKYQFDTQIKSE